MASYGHNYVGPVNAAIAPVEQCRSEFRMFHDLAGRFPFASRFQRAEDDWLRAICAPIWDQGRNLNTLRQGAIRLNAPMIPYADKCFPTPSGKFRFLTEFDPDVLYRTDPSFPYRLLTIAPHGFICSERTLAEHAARPKVILAQDATDRLHLHNGDMVRVESRTGRVRARLNTRAGQRRDILVGERGGWLKAGHSLNRLTPDTPSTVGRGTPFYETWVRVMVGTKTP